MRAPRRSYLWRLQALFEEQVEVFGQGLHLVDVNSQKQLRSCPPAAWISVRDREEEWRFRLRRQVNQPLRGGWVRMKVIACVGVGVVSITSVGSASPELAFPAGSKS